MDDHKRTATRRDRPALLLVAATLLLPALAQAAWPFQAPTLQARPAEIQQATRPLFPWTAPAPAARPATRAPASPFPWAIGAPARKPAPQARVTGPFPWTMPAPVTRPAPRTQPAPAFPFPWPGTPQAAPPTSPFGFLSSAGSRPFGPPSSGFFAAPGATPFGGGMGGVMGPMTGPMAQGMAGILAPMMANYAIASMNPTTMNTFMGLMVQNPTGFGGGFGGGGFPFGGRPQASPFPFGMPGR